ncbi:hypothetical protein LX36DRAFT_200218 [Colletotrichum falcatum]|nr:hypothetical protein LX36DRAFT_200218 [Colletotrichum falcatum]
MTCRTWVCTEAGVSCSYLSFTCGVKQFALRSETARPFRVVYYRGRDWSCYWRRDGSGTLRLSVLCIEIDRTGPNGKRYCLWYVLPHPGLSLRKGFGENVELPRSGGLPASGAGKRRVAVPFSNTTMMPRNFVWRAKSHACGLVSSIVLAT